MKLKTAKHFLNGHLTLDDDEITTFVKLVREMGGNGTRDNGATRAAEQVLEEAEQREEKGPEHEAPPPAPPPVPLSTSPSIQEQQTERPSSPSQEPPSLSRSLSWVTNDDAADEISHNVVETFLTLNHDDGATKGHKASELVTFVSALEEDGVWEATCKGAPMFYGISIKVANCRLQAALFMSRNLTCDDRLAC